MRDWLPLILHYVEPWMSGADIGAGERWSLEIGEELEASQFGIICLTKDNLLAPWILFEAGALAKSVQQGAVCPFLLDVDFGEILGGPLGQFQAKKTDKKSTFELVGAINQRAPTPVADGKLRELFVILWPKLEASLAEVEPAEIGRAPVRPQQEILEELISAVGRLEQRMTREDYLLADRAEEVDSERAIAPIRIVVEAGEFDEHPNGAEFEVTISNSRSFVPTVAKALGFETAGFSAHWFIWDPRTKRALDKKQCRVIDAYLGRLPRVFDITNLPF
jgi:hypothetical protein